MAKQPPRMLGAQPKRTKIPGGMSGCNAPNRRKHYAYSEAAIREAANKLLLSRGVPSMQYCSRNTAEFQIGHEKK